MQHWKSTARRQNYLAPFVTNSYSFLGYVVQIQDKCRLCCISSKSIDDFKFKIKTTFFVSSLNPVSGRRILNAFSVLSCENRAWWSPWLSWGCSEYQSNVINRTSREAEFEIYQFARKFLSHDNFVHADKSLARPGRKQARRYVGDARDFNNIEKRAVIKLFFLQGKAPKEFHAILTETLACFPPGRAMDLSASLYMRLTSTVLFEMFCGKYWNKYDINYVCTMYCKQLLNNIFLSRT